MKYKYILFLTTFLFSFASNAEEILYIDEINGNVEVLRAKLDESGLILSSDEIVNPESVTKDPARNSYLIDASNRYDRDTGEPLPLDKLSFSKYKLNFIFDSTTREPSVNISDFNLWLFDRVYEILGSDECVAKLIDYGISFYQKYEGDSVAYKTSARFNVDNRYIFYPSRNLYIRSICRELQ